MVIKYQISADPTSNEDWVVKIWEAGSDTPGAEVYTELIPEDIGGGHNSIHTVIVNGLDRVVHIVRLYGVTSNQLFHEYNEEPKQDIVTLFDPIKFKIGDGGATTPAAGSNVYSDPILNGLGDDDYDVFRNNYGELFVNRHYYNNVLGGGFTLDGTDVFDDQSEWIVRKRPKTITNTADDPVVGKWFSDFILVPHTTSAVYSSSDLRKLIKMEGICNYSFNINPPSKYAFCFQAFQGTGAAVNSVCTIYFNNAPLKWGNTTKAAITLTDFQSCCLVFDEAAGFWELVYLVDSTIFEVGAGSPLPGSVIGAGRFLITYAGYTNGDVPGGDPQWEIPHNKGIVGDYLVFLSLESNTTASIASNNRVTFTWCHHATDKPNKFIVSLQELSAELQNISINWLIIKL